MKTKENILIRKQEGAIKLSNKTVETLNKSRKKRLNEAFRDNDFLYLNIFFNNITILDLTVLLIKKIENHLKPSSVNRIFQSNIRKIH